MAASLPPLVVSTLSEDCYQTLRRAILDLDLAPGTPLIEGQVAAQLGISKTPVREALARLSSEGLVISEPGRRTRVAGLSAQTVHEVYQVRLMLEPAAIRRVAGRLTEQELARLEQLIADASTALEREDLPAFTAAGHEFHTFLIECTKNARLLSIINELFDQVRRVRAAIYRTEQGAQHHALSQQGIDNHRCILDALADRNADRSEELMAADIQTFLDLFDTPVIRAAVDSLDSPG